MLPFSFQNLTAEHLTEYISFQKIWNYLQVIAVCKPWVILLENGDICDTIFTERVKKENVQ